MRVDVQTLAIVTVFVTTLLGILLVFAGTQNRAVRAPTLWGASFLLGAIGMALMIARGDIPDWLSIHSANALILFGMSLIWAGARMFDARPVRARWVLAAPAVWVGAMAIPAFAEDINARIIAASATMALLALLTAREIWQGRAEPLMSRWPTVLTLLGYAGAMLARIPATLLVPAQQDQPLVSGPLFSFLAFGTLLFTVVLAFLLLNMTKERTELRHKIASLIDPLTGVPNRRAFLDGTEELLAQQRVVLEPLAVLLFDLDDFKTINDRYGHAAGDAVLKTFATNAANTLGPDVLFGRIGGEEFAALVPVGDADEAVAIGDRVRRCFESVAAPQCEGFRPTVSIGVALNADPHSTVATLMAAADRALYRAKANGRNRVESAVPALSAIGETPCLVPAQGERRLLRRVLARG